MNEAALSPGAGHGDGLNPHFLWLHLAPGTRQKGENHFASCSCRGNQKKTPRSDVMNIPGERTSISAAPAAPSPAHGHPRSQPALSSAPPNLSADGANPRCLPRPRRRTAKTLRIIRLTQIDGLLLGTARGQREHPANHRGIKAPRTLIAAVVFSAEQLYLVNPEVHR